MPASEHPSIQGLVELARRDGVDIRPTLVRVLADLYVQEPMHPPAERARFAELACRLLDGVDVATRAAVAERLAAYPGTPAVVAARLARDEIRVADPVLRRSPVLGEAELHAILDSCGIAHAVAIASRSALPASVAKRLRKAGMADQIEARRPQAGARRIAATKDTALTLALARRFLVAPSAERHRILIALPGCPPLMHEERIQRLERSFGARLEAAALRRQAGECAELLRRGMGLPAEIAQRATADPSGEPMAAVCRALELPFNMTARILLFLPPAGGTVQRAFALAGRFEETVPLAARRLMAGWCEIVPAWKGERRERVSAARAPRDTRAIAPRAWRAVTPARPASASEA